MMINGRLLLLAAVIALFGRVWTTNERCHARPVGRHHSLAVQTAPSGSTHARIAATPVSVRGPAQTSAEQVPANPEECWTETTCPIAVPAGMSAGTYRVVNDAGRIAHLTVRNDANAAGDSLIPGAETELFVVTVGQERWYFIRLRNASAPAGLQAERDSSPYITSPTRANRKFDFTGYEAPEWEESRVIEQTSRPVPPELPSPL
jgi:hypothetical protein